MHQVINGNIAAGIFNIYTVECHKRWPFPPGPCHHGFSSAWRSVWLHTNSGLSSTQYEQIIIVFRVWTFWLMTLFFSVSNILTGLGLNYISSFEIIVFLLAAILLKHGALFQCQGLIKWFVIHNVMWHRVFFSNGCSTKWVPYIFLFVFYYFFLMLILICW